MNYLLDFKLDFIGLILVLLYLGLFFSLYTYLLKKESLLTENIIVSSGFSFVIPLVVFLLNQKFSFISIPPDTEVYANVIIDFKNYFNHYSFGVTGYSVLNYLQFKICFERPPVFVVFNIMYYQLAVLYIYKAFKIYCASYHKIIGRRFFLFLQLISIFYPLAILQTTNILREPMLLMLFSINIHLLVKYYFTGFKTYYINILFILLLFLIRPLTGICVFITYFLAYSHLNKFITPKNILKFVVFSILVALIMQQIILSLYSIDFSIEWIAKYREESNSHFGIEGYNNLNWESPIYYFQNFVFLILQYLLSPLPILVSSQITINKFIPLLDSIYIMFILIIIIIRKSKEFNRWLLLFIIFLIIPALVETNISGAYRHRMNSILILFPLFSYYISTMKIKKY